ncbi:MAG: hypothetical protein JJT82_08470 [Legionellaceae bacterium]|nr:hypothetical protein [Legionellaceae bacterium]
MTNAKHRFLNWYNAHRLFLKEPLASQEWDKKIADPLSQKALQSSKKAQKIYQSTEARLVHDYSDLLDGQLRKVVRRLKLKDFADPSGFSDLRKGSAALKRFFACRSTLENFINDDICGHSQRDAQLHAFRRWIEIAKLLLTKHHNYEANSLVIMRLLQIDAEWQFSNELPKSTQSDYHLFCSLLFPSQNFKALRSHIAAHPHPRNFSPTFLLAKDMMFLNEAIGDVHARSKSKALKPSDDAYENVIIKEKMLEHFFAIKKQNRKKLQPHLSQTYTLLTEQYQAVHSSRRSASRPRRHSADAALPKLESILADEGTGHQRKRSKSLDSGDRTNAIPTPSEPIKATNLYTRKLLPSFWNRKCHQERYWEKLHSVDPLHRPPLRANK